MQNIAEPRKGFDSLRPLQNRIDKALFLQGLFVSAIALSRPNNTDHQDKWNGASGLSALNHRAIPNHACTFKDFEPTAWPQSSVGNIRLVNEPERGQHRSPERSLAFRAGDELDPEHG